MSRMQSRVLFDELEFNNYVLEEVEEEFEGNQFGCKLYKTHHPEWFLTDYDHRYYNQPEIYREPSLLKKTGYLSLFKGSMKSKSQHISIGIFRHKEHATQYIDKLIK